MDFTVTLPSNVKSKFHLDNASGSYKTTLARDLDIRYGEYMVALLSIQYDKSWSLFGSDSFFGYARFRSDQEGRTIHKIRISSFPFHSPEDMVSFLQTTLIKFVTSNFLSISYDKNSNRVSFVAGVECGMIFASDDLQKAMGFKYPVMMFKKKRDDLRLKITGDYRPRVDFVDELRILSNVVEPRMINDEVRPLLRTIQPKVESRATGYEEVKHPLYLPALPLSANTIEIKITDSRGKIIEFGYGKVSIDLHFKRIATKFRRQILPDGIPSEMGFGGYHICLTSDEKGEFTTELYQVLNLHSDKHEIALVDASYDVTWTNVDEGVVNLSTNGNSFEYVLPSGRYKNIDEMVNKLNVALEKRSDAIKDLRFFYTRQTNLITIRWFGQGTAELRLSKDIAQIFGVNEDHVLNKHIDSLRTPDINRGMTSLFVYSNLVANRLVGNVSVPLLRIIPLYNTRYETVRHEFQHLLYVPTNSFEGRYLRTFVGRDNGDVVNFPGGKLILNLHIRQKQSA
jgi:hypothetical protein